jgi:YHS domain-containing protein
MQTQINNLINFQTFLRTWLVLSLLIGGFQTSAFAQKDLKPYFNVDSDGLWVEGYDAVAYNVEHKAVEGKKEFAVSYNGATFRFANSKNQQLFKASPTKYLPEYGGYCSYALGATGEKVEVNPETFKVINGKVYLFYNKFFNNTLKDWNKDEQNLHASADKNWAKQKHASK